MSLADVLAFAMLVVFGQRWSAVELVNARAVRKLSDRTTPDVILIRAEDGVNDDKDKISKEYNRANP